MEDNKDLFDAEPLFWSLRRWITCIDGPVSDRQRMMTNELDNIHQLYRQQKAQLHNALQEAAKYRDLADQRLLNHLNIDEDHIIDIVNESLPSVATNELGPINDIGHEPIRIPPIPVEPIEFKYD